MTVTYASATRNERNNTMTTDFRIEKDSLGPVQVPADALYGAQTMRAVENLSLIHI